MPRYTVFDEQGKEIGEFDEHAPEVEKARTTPGWGFQTITDAEIRERDKERASAAAKKAAATRKANQDDDAGKKPDASKKS